MNDRCPGVPGDIVVFPRTTYDHYAVNVGGNYIVHVTSISDNPGSLDVAGICCYTSDKLAVVKKEKFSDFKNPNDKPYVETNWKGKTPLKNYEVVQRALSKEREKGYSVLFKNCEHFAHWCRYNEEVSDQADALMTGTKYAAGAGLVVGALGALYHVISKSTDHSRKEVVQRVPFNNYEHSVRRYPDRYNEEVNDQADGLRSFFAAGARLVEGVLNPSFHVRVPLRSTHHSRRENRRR